LKMGGTIFNVLLASITRYSEDAPRIKLLCSPWCPFSVQSAEPPNRFEAINETIQNPRNPLLDVRRLPLTLVCVNSFAENASSVRHPPKNQPRSTLPLIPNFPKKLFAGGDVCRSFNTLGRIAVNYAQHPATLLSLGNDHFYWVGGRAKN
jgi:hypothetical protein